MFTIVGGNGFIGTRLVQHLRAAGHECQLPVRGADLSKRELGCVIWCAGVTADFRRRPFDTVTSHVSDLMPLLQYGKFESLVYLSSTRVYKGSERGDEGAPLTVSSADPDDLYNLSKLMGESIALGSGRDRVHVARLSNVYGRDFDSDNFLTHLLRAALSGRVSMQTAPDSSKDYICVDDVVELLAEISARGSAPIYNLATGVNVTNAELTGELMRASGCVVDWVAGAPSVRFPIIDVTRARESFGRTPERRLLRDLPSLLQSFRETVNHDHD